MHKLGENKMPPTSVIKEKEVCVELSAQVEFIANDFTF